MKLLQKKLFFLLLLLRLIGERGAGDDLLDIDGFLMYFSFFSFGSKESRVNGQYQQSVDVLNNDNK